MTDGPFDQSELGPDNLSEILPRDPSTSSLPLKPGQWNQMKVVLNEQAVTLELNGSPICKTSIDAVNDCVFGLFHYADQTDARVRNVVMRGSWPTKLPDVTAQELADKRPAALDADLVNLPGVFTYQFTASQIPVRFFEVGRNQPDDTVSAGRDGLQIVRPGGGPWFDTHVHLPFMIHGDFDMEIGFEPISDTVSKISFIMVFQSVEECNKMRNFIAEKNEENFDRLERELLKM